MKHYIILNIILLFSNSLFSQSWPQVYGEPYKNDYIESIYNDYDGGFLVLAGYDNKSFWLFKTDINGNVLWERNFEDAIDYANWPDKIVRDHDGNIIIVGGRLLELISLWPYMIKLNPCGDMIQCYEYADTNYWWGWFEDVLVLDNNDILCLAKWESQEQIDQIFLHYIDADGNHLWKRSYASQTTYPEIDSRNAYELKHMNSSYWLTGYCYHSYPGNPNHWFLHPLYIKIDSAFNEEWILPFGVTDSLHGFSVSSVQISDSVFMGVGRYYDYDTSISQISDKSWLIFYDSDGNEKGYNLIPHENIDTGVIVNGTFLIERMNDSLFVTQSFWCYNQDYCVTGELLIDTAGNVYDKHYYPTSINDGDIGKTFDNKYIVGTGILENKSDKDIMLYKINEHLEIDSTYGGIYTYDSLCPGGIQSSTIDLSSCSIYVGEQEVADVLQKNEYNLSVFPTPASTHATVSIRGKMNDHNIYLQCFNSMGVQVYNSALPKRQEEAKIDISSWPPGLYNVVLRSEENILAGTKLVVVR